MGGNPGHFSGLGSASGTIADAIVPRLGLVIEIAGDPIRVVATRVGGRPPRYRSQLVSSKRNRKFARQNAF